MASTATTASTTASVTPSSSATSSVTSATAASTQQSVTPAKAAAATTQPSSAPAKSTAASTQPTPAPAKSTAASIQPSAIPTKSTAASTKPTPAPATSTAASTQPSAAPAKSTAASTQPSAAPAKSTTASTLSSAAPEKSTAASTQPSAAPAKSTAASTQPSAAPAKSTAASTQPSAASAKSTAASTQPSAAPAKATAASTQPSAAPAKTTAVPTQASPKPAVATVVPASTSVKPPTSVVSPTQAIVTPIPHAKGAMSLKNTKDMDTLYKKPWRGTIDWENPFEALKDLKDEIENYEPLENLLTDEVQFPRVNILLLGSVGAGKSSVFNTINSVFRGKIFNVARCGYYEHSLTTKFTRYPVMSASRTVPVPLKFRICDIRGLEQDHLMTKENMRYILEGNIADRFPFDPSGNLSSDMPGFKKNPDLDEKIHCVCFVQDATIVDALQELNLEVTNNLREMQTVMNSLDIPQVVILTKIDSLCTKTKDNIANVFYSPKVERCVAKVSEVLGLPRNSVFPLKNYEMEYQLDPNIDILSLLTLKGILNYCDAHLFNYRDEITKRYAVANKR